MSKVGRNEPCPCGSGKKYKKCHLNEYESSSLLGVAAQGSVVSCMVNNDFEESGLAVVFVVRQHPNSRNINIVIYLCDLFCLGVKDVSVFPSSNEHTVENLQAHYPLHFVDIDYQTARDLVLGSIAYAKTLDFKPHPDWEKSKDFIEFDRPFNPKRFNYGRDGKPFYVAGPKDDYDMVFHTLEASCGKGNFDYLNDERTGYVYQEEDQEAS
jgi:hypothetical protein